MIQTQLYTAKLTEGQTKTVKDLETAEPDYSFSIHTAIMLGNYDDLTTVVINGTSLDLPGAFVYNQTPIASISVTTSSHGVYIIGKKTKKQLFN